MVAVVVVGGGGGGELFSDGVGVMMGGGKQPLSGAGAGAESYDCGHHVVALLQHHH